MTTSRPIIPLEEIQEKTLQIMCSNSGECVTFGRFISILNEYFEDFDLKYVISPITRLGKPSSNGFVNEFIFEKKGYKLYTILKSSLKRFSDNLIYEYLVGKYYINTLIRKLPCFVETYHLYFFTNGKNGIYRQLRDNNINNASILESPMKKPELGILDTQTIPDLINFSCNYPINHCILIQHIENAISFGQFLKENKDIYTKTIDLLQILMQIYIPIGRLMNQFTHNDLHTDNILLYKIPNNKYIEMIYHLENGQTIQFKTKYIAKIIDYGRCYFDNTTNNDMSSRKIFDIIEQSPVCNYVKTHYGGIHEVGYNFFEEVTNIDNYYISTLKGNISKDLWCPIIIHFHMNYIGEDNFKNQLIYELDKVLQEIIFDDENFEFGGLSAERAAESDCIMDSFYIEHVTSCNVDMFARNLIYIYERNNVLFREMQEEYFSDNQLFGKMDIYMDLMKETEFQIIDNIPRTIGGRKQKHYTKKHKFIKKQLKTKERKYNTYRRKK